MLMTIALRIGLSVAVMLLLLIGFSGTVYVSFSKQSQYRQIETDTDEIYRMSNRLLSQLKDAETGQRGYLLTGEDRYLKPFHAAEAQVPQTLQSLHSHEAGDPVLKAQLGKYDAIVAAKFAELHQTINLFNTAGLPAALAVVKNDTGQTYMEDARALSLEISDTQKLALTRILAREDLLDQRIKTLILIGAPAIALLGFVGFMVATRRIVTAVRRLEVGVTQVGSSQSMVTLDIPGKDEFSRLASSFNGMAARLSAAKFAQDRAESALRENNDNLKARGDELEKRTRTLDLLGRIAHRLPGCSNEAEFGELLERYVPQIFPDTPGALFLLNPSHTLLRRMAVWNGPKACLDEFGPADCWSLRRGQQHINNDFSHEVVCRHIDPAATSAYMCWPLVAQNETVGLLYVEHGDQGSFLGNERTLQDVNVLCETIALALVNLHLRQTLRDQSIRDSLTGLFNRRYLEESLELEFSRAERGGQPIAIIMIDVDHFKRFNDTFGHAAGDMVLKKGRRDHRPQHPQGRRGVPVRRRGVHPGTDRRLHRGGPVPRGTGSRRRQGLVDGV